MKPLHKMVMRAGLRVLQAYPDGAVFLVHYLNQDGKKGSWLRVIVSNEGGWDHVSVSLPHRCPSWAEMEFVKRLFFEDFEVAMQLHVPVADHISCHPYCLHIWSPQDVEIPRPPSWMVSTPQADEIVRQARERGEISP